MAKRVLLISGNYYPELTGIGKYTGEMVDWLSKKGFSCVVITTYPYYPNWEVDVNYKKKQWWYSTEEIEDIAGNKIKVYRCPHYIPKEPTGFNRIFSELSIFFSYWFIIIGLLFAKKFESVIVSSPPFHLGLYAICFKWLRGSKFLYHVYDLQIDAAMQLNMIRSKYLMWLLVNIEKFIIKNCDVISTLTEGMKYKLQKKCDREVVLFPNWVDTNAFYPIQNKEILKSRFNFSSFDKIILYSGAIGEKQGLDIILTVAKNLQNYKQFKFVICGSGPYKKRLIESSMEMNLNNIFFLDLQPLEELNSLLNFADLHLVLQKNDASDLVMPSKLTTILAVGGTAIITAKKETSLFHLVSNNNIGVLIPPESTEELENAILTTCSNSQRLISNNARKFSELNFSIDKVISNYMVHL